MFPSSTSTTGHSTHLHSNRDERVMILSQPVCLTLFTTMLSVMAAVIVLIEPMYFTSNVNLLYYILLVLSMRGTALMLPQKTYFNKIW